MRTGRATAGGVSRVLGRAGLACVLATTLLGGCGDGAAKSEPTGKTVPIGYVGLFANQASLALMNHVVREINDAGGITLEDGEHTLELVPVDHGATLEGAIAAMNELADRGVTLVIDPPWSSMILGPSGDGSDGATGVAVERDMLVISGGATSPLISTLDDDGRIFRTVPSDAVQGAVGAEHLRGEGVRTASILYRDDAYGRGLSESFREAFEASGGEVFDVVAYDPAAASPGADFSAELDAVFSGEPEAVLFVTFDELYDIANQVNQGDYFERYPAGKPVLFGTDGPFNPDEFLVNLPERFLERFSGTIPGSERNTRSYERFLDELKKSDIDPDAYDGPRYDAVFLLALGVQAAFSASASDVKEVLGEVSRFDAGDVVVGPGEWAKAKAALLEGKSIDYAGASGSVEFDEAGDRTKGVILVWDYVDDRDGPRIDTTHSVPYDLSE